MQKEAKSQRNFIGNITLEHIRVDVLENVGVGTVCVYDIKTGVSKLSPARMVEIASNVHSVYTGTKKDIGYRDETALVATTIEVKRLLKPLLTRHKDIAIVGRLLIVLPVRHHLRAVLIDRTSRAHSFKPHWFVYHLFGPNSEYGLSWGDQLSARPLRAWRTTEPDMAKVLIEKIEADVLPKLRPVKTLEDFVLAALASPGGHLWSKDPWGKSLIDIAMGDLESASSLCRDHICDRPEPGPKEPDSWKAEFAGGKRLCTLLASDDREGLISQLHEWEAANVKALKIDHLWEPSPFPIETMRK